MPSTLRIVFSTRCISNGTEDGWKVTSSSKLLSELSSKSAKPHPFLKSCTILLRSILKSNNLLRSASMMPRSSQRLRGRAKLSAEGFLDGSQQTRPTDGPMQPLIPCVALQAESLSQLSVPCLKLPLCAFARLIWDSWVQEPYLDFEDFLCLSHIDCKCI